VLAVTGFRSSDAAHQVDQPAAALTGITAGMSVLPAVIAAASLLLLHRHSAAPIPHRPLQEEPARAD